MYFYGYRLMRQLIFYFLTGCFVLAVPDRCYTAKNGISYCWCSGKDLCNSARSNYCFQFIPNFFLILLFWIIVLFR